jgi:hypothetical protein
MTMVKMDTLKKLEPNWGMYARYAKKMADSSQLIHFTHKVA